MVRAKAGGGVGGDVEECVLVEGEVVDYFEWGGDGCVVSVLFGVEEVLLVGVGVVEDGNLRWVSGGW